MAEFLFGLLEVSLTMSLVITALLLLGKRLDRRFVPQWRYWAWLAVALRLALPFNISLPQAPVTVEVPPAAVRVERPVKPAGPTEVYLNTTPAKDWPEPEEVPQVGGVQEIAGSDLNTIIQVERIPLSSFLFAVWAVGTCGFFSLQIIFYVNFKRKIWRWSRPAVCYEGIPVLESELVTSPMLMGLLRPVIVVPAGGASEYALLHEYTHARRHDLWYKLLLVVVNALHWFNPLVWLLRRAAAGDVEIACDAAVLSGRDEDYRRAYGLALLDTVRGGRRPAAALTSAFSGSKRSMKQRFRALVDMAPKHPGRAALALVCAVALLGGSLVACRTEEPEESKTPHTPAIPAGDLYDEPSGLYFSPYVGAGVIIPEALRDRIMPRHREKTAGDPVVEFLDREAADGDPMFTIETFGSAYPTGDAQGKTMAESWFQADAVQFLTGVDGALYCWEPAVGVGFTLDGALADGLVLISKAVEGGASLLCVHREMLGQLNPDTARTERSGLFQLALVEGRAVWSFGWKEDWLVLSEGAKAQCESILASQATIQESLDLAGPEPLEDGTFFVRDLLYEDGNLTFTPLERREDGTWLARPDQRQTLPLAEDVVWASPAATVEAFFQELTLSSAWIDSLSITTKNGEINTMTEGNLGMDTHITVTTRNQTYALSATYDETDRVLTYTPISVNESDMSYSASGLGPQSVQVAETVALKGGYEPPETPEDEVQWFLRTPTLSAWWPMGLKLTMEHDVLIEMEWVQLTPPKDIPAAETRLGVLSGRVDVEAGTVSGLWLDEAGQIDRDAPFTLPVAAGANIQVLDNRGFYTGPITLADLEQLLLPLSSFGPTFELSILDGRVVGIVTHEDIVTNQELREGKPGTEGWKFHNLYSQNPGDGTYSAQWESLKGVYNRMKLDVEAETDAVLTYTVTDPGEGFVMALVFEDGAVQRLGEGENTVTLPAGRTTLAIGGVEGTAGGFTLSYTPADEITMNG